MQPAQAPYQAQRKVSLVQSHKYMLRSISYCLFFSTFPKNISLLLQLPFMEAWMMVKTIKIKTTHHKKHEMTLL